MTPEQFLQQYQQILVVALTRAYHAAIEHAATLQQAADSGGNAMITPIAAQAMANEYKEQAAQFRETVEVLESGVQL